MKIFLFTLILLSLTALPAMADDAATLVERDCSSCHGSEVYTRSNRMVEFLADLELQVERCNKGTGAGWTDDQVEAVVEYLNTSYYRF